MILVTDKLLDTKIVTYTYRCIEFDNVRYYKIFIINNNNNSTPHVERLTAGHGISI